MKPYFTDGTVELYHGDFREVVPQLQYSFDLVIADPPYEETAIKWDRWPDYWPAFIADQVNAMWCFGSMRMLLNRAPQILPYWNFSHDIVWEKHNGTGFSTDRFKRVHEFATHWYRGSWEGIHHEVPRTPYTGPDKHVRARNNPGGEHLGKTGTGGYVDVGERLARSVLKFKSVRGGIHPTQKPVGLLELMVGYGCPSTGVVLDPFAGSGSTLVAARNLGRRAIGVEGREEQCEKTAIRLSQGVLEFEGGDDDAPSLGVVKA